MCQDKRFSCIFLSLSFILLNRKHQAWIRPSELLTVKAEFLTNNLQVFFIFKSQVRQPQHSFASVKVDYQQNEQSYSEQEEERKKLERVL